MAGLYKDIRDEPTLAGPKSTKTNVGNGVFSKV